MSQAAMRGLLKTTPVRRTAAGLGYSALVNRAGIGMTGLIAPYLTLVSSGRAIGARPIGR